MSSMSHTSGIDTTSGSSISKFEKPPLGGNVGGVGGRNHTPHLVNPSNKPTSRIQIPTLVHDETLTLIRISLKTLNL